MTRRPAGRWCEDDLEALSEAQLAETCLRLEGRVRMLRIFLADLHRENATLQRQRAMLSERLGEMEERGLGPPAWLQAGQDELLNDRQLLQASRPSAGVQVCEHQLSRAQMEQDSADRLQRLTAREELELRRCHAQEEQLRLEVCEHQLSRAQMEQELELRRCQAQEEEEEEMLQMEAGMVQPSDVRGFFKGAAWAHEHTPMSSEQKILLGPPSAHASVTFTRAPEPSKAEARSERSERSDSHESQPSQPSRPSPSRLLAVLSHSSSPRGPSGARSSVSSTYPGGAQSPVFAYHTHIQQKVPPAEVAWQRGSSLELQLPPPPRSSPARDSELRPADLKLTVLTSDSRLETLMFRSDGNFEKQALEFLMQKKLKAAFVGGLAAKMKAMVAAGQAQSSVDIVDLI